MKEEKRQGTDLKRDISSKKILGNPILYAQFLRNNVKIPFLKNVQPEDIEDVSERYIPYLGTEFESDTVKRVYIHNRQNTDHIVQEHMSADTRKQDFMQVPFF